MLFTVPPCSVSESHVKNGSTGRGGKFQCGFQAGHLLYVHTMPALWVPTPGCVIAVNIMIVH